MLDATMLDEIKGTLEAGCTDSLRRIAVRNPKEFFAALTLRKIGKQHMRTVLVVYKNFLEKAKREGKIDSMELAICTQALTELKDIMSREEYSRYSDFISELQGGV